MTFATLRDVSPLLTGLSPDTLRFLETNAIEAEFAANEVVFEEDDPADTFYVVEEGRIALEVELPSRGLVVIETLGGGELLGVSWLFPPAHWNWRARALVPTRAVGFDAAAVRGRCDEDIHLALHVYETVAAAAVRRLHATRLRLLDIYRGADR